MDFANNLEATFFPNAETNDAENFDANKCANLSRSDRGRP